MKQIKLKVLFLLIVISLIGVNTQAQRGVRIGYIDTEYILQNIPEYQQATSQLDKKVLQWKQEIETKLSEIEQQRKDLSNEKVLLTKELIEEREEDIAFEEKEILDYQQKRFGPNGDLMIQKKQLIQPIQDQIFAAVQDMAEKRKYDFVFDKSADVVMLYSAERFDFSDEVIRSITRSNKRQQATSRAERKAADEEEVLPEINEEQEAREKAQDDRRDSIMNAREQRKLEIQKRRDSIIAAREQSRQDKIDSREAESNDEVKAQESEEKEAQVNDEATETKSREEILEERRQKKLADRERRKQELEARKQKIIEEREKAKEQEESPDEDNEDN